MKVLQFLQQNLLLILTILAIVLGVIAGLVCRLFEPSSDTVQVVQFPGELFLRMLRMLILPLIISSIITGLGNVTGSSAGKIGVLSMMYYASTSILATLVGLAVVLIIKPGSYTDSTATYVSQNNDVVSGMDAILDLFRNLIPDNIVAATVQHSTTVSVAAEDEGVHSVNSSADERINGSMEVNNIHHPNSTKETLSVKGENILGLLTYCIVFGVTLSKLGQRGAALIQFFSQINTVTVYMIKLVMWYSPFGVMSLIMGQIMSAADISKTGQTVAVYMATEMAGLAVHSVVVLPAMYFILTRQNPYLIYLRSLPALLTAFATSSSAAALPVTMQCVEERLQMDKRISRVILPVGATVNMDGGAVYGVVAAVFIAQYNGITLSFGDFFIICLTAFLTSIGTASIPGSDLAMLMLVIRAIGLPVRGASLLLTINWLMDRCGTTVNVASDCLMVGVVSRFTNLPPRDPSETQFDPVQEEERMIADNRV
ncbi:excitatory amino acid transporter-like [Haliotis rubra]|uniref:excitatory amino acid transporter-like n=1 Tax=Haliotis rubra TaxID=36100 RepID=UPI001EE56E59|nr:excitatory amino acid transporter-like [Haliotis rubra]